MDDLEKISYPRAYIGAPPPLAPSQPDDDVSLDVLPPGWSFSKPDVPPGISPPRRSFGHGNHGVGGFPDDASGDEFKESDLADDFDDSRDRGVCEDRNVQASNPQSGEEDVLEEENRFERLRILPSIRGCKG